MNRNFLLLYFLLFFILDFISWNLTWIVSIVTLFLTFYFILLQLFPFPCIVQNCFYNLSYFTSVYSDLHFHFFLLLTYFALYFTKHVLNNKMLLALFCFNFLQFHTFLNLDFTICVYFLSLLLLFLSYFVISLMKPH